ncbi:MAG: hypothetical protein IKC64_00460 [Clostridia bacterium]|nr:hypothetical protein [Clostridia bacterium]
MLYKKNSSKDLSTELFKNPTCEYRCTPFWAWNTKLKKEELLWQIEQFKKMGFGGFHMHSRSGMGTKYLSDEFMDLVKACNEKAKQMEMLAWLYDEDRWPSGAAGGIVTKNPKHRAKILLFTTKKLNDTVEKEDAVINGKPYFLACYDIVLNLDGTLKSYDMISQDGKAKGTKWFAYVKTQDPSGWYNNQTYVDTLDKEAMQEFIRVTYDAYDKAVGKDFGESVPAIFTDEPQFSYKDTLPFASSKNNLAFPWTTTLLDFFAERYGYDFLPHIPEIIWNLPGDEPSQPRYHYHDAICEMFSQAFSDQCGTWCDNHGIALTGHVLHEENLHNQTKSVGEAMRMYRGFGIPGIDILCDNIELATAKQTQSAVHQYGKEGMLSELYGVTGWDFDFRGHKFQGDWQAALGVTVRVPHLSWVSMKGSAKRDYPASISYQSAWYEKYNYVEDHFARLNTALTRGVPSVNVAVIHPIESYWLNYGPQENTADKRRVLESQFDQLINFLLRGTIDFDFVSEGMLPDIYTNGNDGKFTLGAMKYNAVVVPPVQTLRTTTINALTDFVNNGGKVIFTGACPECVDGKLSEGAKALYEIAQKVHFSQIDILNALSDEREIEIKNADGASSNNLIYNKRNDGDTSWLFIAHVDKIGEERFYNPAIDVAQHIFVKVRGCYKVSIYDTISGKILPVSYEATNGYTTISTALYASDSVLIRLDKGFEGDKFVVADNEKAKLVRRIDYKDKVKCSFSELNPVVLDLAKYSFDGKKWSEIEEIARIDLAIRREFGYPLADGHDCQPWVIEEEKPDIFPYLKFEFRSEIVAPCSLAYEEAVEIEFNGEKVEINPDGYYTDKDIVTTKLPNLKKGKNTLIVKVPISKRISMENMFLLGNFGVRTEGTKSTVVALPKELAFGSIVNQGLPFYGAVVNYELPVTLRKDATLKVFVPRYKGALVGVKLDGKEVGNIVYSPYCLEIKGVEKGKHTITLSLYCSRVYSFSGLHCSANVYWKGPSMYYTGGNTYSYEYYLLPIGIMQSPVIEVFDEK